MSTYATRLIVGYIHNLLATIPRTSPMAHNLVSWLDGNLEPLGLAPGFDWEKAIGRRNTLSAKNWQAFYATVTRRRNLLRAKPDRLWLNLRELAAETHLDDLEFQILELLLLKTKDDHGISSLLEAHNDTGPFYMPKIIATILGTAVQNVQRALSPAARLLTTGLVTDDGSYSGWTHEMPNYLVGGLMPPNTGMKDLRTFILGPKETTELGWDDYEHISRDRDLVCSVLSGAMKEHARGVNILIHGPTGTGKTEFCRMIAKRLRYPLHSLGNKSLPQGRRINEDRCSQLQLALKIAQSGTLLLFDEMEDILDAGEGLAQLLGHGRMKMDKSKANSTLETNALPVLWTSNNIEVFDEAFLRRMTMVVEIGPPPAKVRERILRRSLERQSLSLCDADITSLAKGYKAAPALVVNAVKAASLAGGETMANIRHLLGLSLKAIHGKPQSVAVTGLPEFSMDLIHPDANLAEITDRLASHGPGSFSLLLYGPPGTGKSFYLRHLADKMGMEVLLKRASDLKSMYVGETERNIAEAFSEARDTGAFLIFDEADSLLFARGMAHQSWEISEVNEMLTWMEQHPLPFACTTNLLDIVDDAAMRRFLFKVKFQHLPRVKVAAAFNHYFGMPSTGPVALDNLTAGDFAVVSRKAALLGNSRDAKALMTLLEQESCAKPGAGKRKTGFKLS
jgi:SpoVK/Ycf46/Vps4 family AAA+-type ATPase